MEELFEVTCQEKTVRLSSKTRHAKGMLDRMIGLMFAPPTVEIDGLLIEPCNSIHTFFMRFNLDLVFLSGKNVILKIQRDVKPWRMTWIVWRSVKVLELKAGMIPGDLKIGDKLEFSCIR
ncbi:MAG: hypothetical protein A2X86_04165 [Bdellovibrionales bacterium GWA2_49_15]|nr:MAG: hypothetical protein A2X86_04165 [Bdellovibrionales bacterium GWA2_49_15]HAZ12799.1 DUF192 domain-containing protein [Bdellovibrionales bacterium]